MQKILLIITVATVTSCSFLANEAVPVTERIIEDVVKSESERK